MKVDSLPRPSKQSDITALIYLLSLDQLAGASPFSPAGKNGIKFPPPLAEAGAGASGAEVTDVDAEG